MILTRRRALIGGAAALLLPRPAIIRPARAGLVMAPTSASRAIAYVSSTQLGNNVSSPTTTLTSPITLSSVVDGLLVVGITGDVSTGADDIISVIYGSSPLTLAIKNPNTGSSGVLRFDYIYYLLNPATGTNNVVITATTSHILIAVAAYYSGVKQSGQPDATTTNGVYVGGFSTLTTSITTVSNNAWAILLEQHDMGSLTTLAGAGASLRVTDPTYNQPTILDSGGPITPAGAFSMTTSMSSADEISHTIASFAHA